MSTRAGEYISLSELVDEVGKDAARFFFLMRKCDSHLEFDLELAKSKTMDNPVYYIQYAHARICRVLAQQDARFKTKDGEFLNIGSFGKLSNEEINFSLLKETEAIDLIRDINRFSDVIPDCAANMDPQGLTTYLRELAAGFHAFYNQHRVITEDHDLTVARVILICCVSQVLRIGLSLLGVAAPEKM